MKNAWLCLLGIFIRVFEKLFKNRKLILLRGIEITSTYAYMTEENQNMK
jgi:hypothetical protein